MENTLITPSTKKTLIYVAIFFAVAFIGLLLAGYGKKIFGKSSKGGKDQGNGSITNGGMASANIDLNYITRIGVLVKKVLDEGGGLKWDTSAQCEVCQNILTMRPEEIMALSNFVTTNYSISLKSAVDKYGGMGCGELDFFYTKYNQVKKKVASS